MSRSRRLATPQGQLGLFDLVWRTTAMAYEEGCSAEQGLMERVVSPEVISLAISRVKVNKGAPGVDGKTVDELDELWALHGAKICQVLVAGDYIPRPVRQKAIPKPGGGERMLGIPTVLDRLVQTMLGMVVPSRRQRVVARNS